MITSSSERPPLTEARHEVPLWVVVLLVALLLIFQIGLVVSTLH